MASTTFRFYAELNDFLSPAERQREVRLEFDPPVPVGHLIETLGVPHTEVEIILVNGDSVALDHRLSDADRVSVYPMFEALDVSPLLRIRRQPLRLPHFLADVHLGKLAGYLRMLGFDTLWQTGGAHPRPRAADAQRDYPRLLHPSAEAQGSARLPGAAARSMPHAAAIQPLHALQRRSQDGQQVSSGGTATPRGTSQTQ